MDENLRRAKQSSRTLWISMLSARGSRRRSARYLIPLLGVWDRFDQIDFDKLPDKFMLKTNHGAGWNYPVPDKSKLDKEDAKKSLIYGQN